jgi:glycosyltransferase involved in cell wall biosynthesis
MRESHTFAICAYKESPYLEDCIRSVKGQSIKSNVLIATSTPNEWIDKLAEKYDIPVYVNTKEKGITQDWNFAYSCCDTDLITLAHQDDVYGKHYVEEMFKCLSQAADPLIYFTGYAELRNGKIAGISSMLKIKRMMLWPLTIKMLQKNIFIRRAILSLGNPICCPAVTFVKHNGNLPDEIFSHGFRSNEDWEAWEKLSRLKGEFVYKDRTCVLHRIHEGSETSIILGENKRHEEDFVMFHKFWPKSIAGILSKIYSSCEKFNSV